MKNINDIIDKINQSPDFDTAFKTLENAKTHYGFDNFLFTKINTRNSPTIFNVELYKGDYPVEWSERYLEKSYFFIDPVAKLMLANHAPFFWSKAVGAIAPDQETIEMMHDAASYGLCDGVGLCYLKNQGNLYTLSFSKKEMIEDYDDSVLADLYLIGSHFISAYEKFNHHQKPSDIELSAQEQKIVTFGAIGKTDSEIAQIMDISVNTIRYHWKNIFEKFECYGRVFAIIQALNLGLLDQSILKVTTEVGSSEIFHKAV